MREAETRTERAGQVGGGHGGELYFMTHVVVLIVPGIRHFLYENVTKN